VPERPTPSVLRLGVVLPRSGSPELAQYSTLIQEGIELAMAEYMRGAGNRPVELVVLDDRGDTRTASQQVAQLDSSGAVAILGPLMSPAVEAAATNRRDRDLLILSPTASATPAGARYAYSLNADDSRGAAVLARYVIGRGMRRLAVLYPETEESSIQARAFAAEVQNTQGASVLQVSFDPNTTTFSAPINRLRAARIEAVFVPATEREIRQIAPQFVYYGLRDAQILGNDAWTSEEILRNVDPNALEGVIAATPLLPQNTQTGWNEFVQLYEQTHRRTLDNPYPALGYDAARIVLDAIAAGKTGRADIAKAISEISAFRGATGVLSFRDGQVTRQPFLVRIQRGRLVPVADAGGA
jgi:branched-chain amino acid transport system substrate-binding protein